MSNTNRTDAVLGMPIARADVHYPLNGGIMITSFSTERAALAFVREEGLASYKVLVNDYVLAREGAWAWAR